MANDYKTRRSKRENENSEFASDVVNPLLALLASVNVLVGAICDCVTDHFQSDSFKKEPRHSRCESFVKCKCARVVCILHLAIAHVNMNLIPSIRLQLKQGLFSFCFTYFLQIYSDVI